MFELLADTTCLERGYLPDTDVCSLFQQHALADKHDSQESRFLKDISICKQDFLISHGNTDVPKSTPRTV